MPWGRSDRGNGGEARVILTLDLWPLSCFRRQTSSVERQSDVWPCWRRCYCCRYIILSMHRWGLSFCFHRIVRQRPFDWALLSLKEARRLADRIPCASPKLRKQPKGGLDLIWLSTLINTKGKQACCEHICSAAKKLIDHEGDTTFWQIRTIVDLPLLLLGTERMCLIKKIIAYHWKKNLCQITITARMKSASKFPKGANDWYVIYTRVRMALSSV